jgi:hypothetical protein
MILNGLNENLYKLKTFSPITFSTILVTNHAEDQFTLYRTSYIYKLDLNSSNSYYNDPSKFDYKILYPLK